MSREQQKHTEHGKAVQRQREMQAVTHIREHQKREIYLLDKQMMRHGIIPEQHSRVVAIAVLYHQRQQEQQFRVMQIPIRVSSFQQSGSNTYVSKHQEKPL